MGSSTPGKPRDPEAAGGAGGAVGVVVVVGDVPGGTGAGANSAGAGAVEEEGAPVRPGVGAEAPCKGFKKREDGDPDMAVALCGGTAEGGWIRKTLSGCECRPCCSATIVGSGGRGQQGEEKRVSGVCMYREPENHTRGKPIRV